MIYICSILHCALVSYYLFGVVTKTELDALKRIYEKTEKELRASRTRAQQLATKNEEMAVSYSTFITITHVTCMVVRM